MKILISGGSGFIGKNLLNHLIKKNMNIMIIGRNLDSISLSNVRKITFDLNNSDYDYQEIIKYNPDVFIHLAWEGIPNYSEEFSKKNYLNTMRIIKVLVKSTNCSKIISTGSCWEYNDGNIKGRCHEDIVSNLKKPFSIYKNKIFKEVSIIAKKNKIIFNWLRLFYVYGPGQRKESIIPMLIKALKNKKKINLNYPGNTNDYIHIDDVIKIISYFVSKNIISGIYNVGSGKGLEVKKLLEIIDYKINGKNILTNEYLDKIERNKKNQDFYACTKKLKKYLKNIEFIDIDRGIQNLIEKV
jgi:nucleoside-diphosphate-sugar epimerase